MKAQSPNYWAVKEFPQYFSFFSQFDLWFQQRMLLPTPFSWISGIIGLRHGNNNGNEHIIKWTSQAVQWLRLRAPNAGGPGFIPGRGTRSHMLQLRPSAAKKKKKKTSLSHLCQLKGFVLWCEPLKKNCLFIWLHLDLSCGIWNLRWVFQGPSLRHTASTVVVFRLSCSEARGIPAPRPGTEPESPVLQGSPGSPCGPF